MEMVAAIAWSELFLGHMCCMYSTIALDITLIAYIYETVTAQMYGQLKFDRFASSKTGFTTSTALRPYCVRRLFVYEIGHLDLTEIVEYA